MSFSVWNEIKAAGKKVEDVLADVGGALQRASDFYTKVKTTWAQVSGPTITAASNVFYDAVQTLSSGEAAAAAAATGNISSTITLSQTTIANVQKLIADAKAGEAVAVADLQLLGIKI